MVLNAKNTIIEIKTKNNHFDDSNFNNILVSILKKVLKKDFKLHIQINLKNENTTKVYTILKQGLSVRNLQKLLEDEIHKNTLINEEIISIKIDTCVSEVLTKAIHDNATIQSNENYKVIIPKI